jgi:hypothetical protein
MGTVRAVVCAVAILVVCTPRTFAEDCLADCPSGDGGEWCTSDSCNQCGYSCVPDGCCSNCGCCSDCGCSDCGSSLCCLLPSDHCFDRFISPLSNPFFFEDPRSLTEVRTIFIDNNLPRSIGGGDVDVWAAQVRLRFSDRWSAIAPRLGYIDVNQGGNPPEGFMSAPVGLKFNFYRDVDRQALASAGVTYFIPGSERAFSNFGDGDFHFFLTGGTEIYDGAHWLSGTGFRIPTDSNWGTQMWYWSNQWDCEVVDHWYGLLGVNWFHWMRSAGLNVGAPITGLDLLNIPVSGVAGDDVVTGVVGGKWKPGRHMELGTGFEFPLTDRTDILATRIYADLTLRY